MSGIRGRKKSESVQDANPLIGISRKRSRRDFYVYVYLDPRKPGKYVYSEYEFDHEPFYVGKGAKKRYRPENHQAFVGLKIKRIQSKGLKVIILILLNGLTNDEVISKEMLLISLIGRCDLKTGPLCNLTNGGEGIPGRKKGPCPEHVKEAVRKANTGRSPWSEGLKMTSDFCAKIANYRKGKTMPEEVKKKISVAVSKRNATAEWSEKHSQAMILAWKEGKYAKRGIVNRTRSKNQ